MELLLLLAWLVLGNSSSKPLVKESIRFEPVEIDLVIGNRYERLAFERAMRNRKEMFYASKVDYLININEIHDIF